MGYGRYNNTYAVLNNQYTWVTGATLSWPTDQLVSRWPLQSNLLDTVGSYNCSSTGTITFTGGGVYSANGGSNYFKTANCSQIQSNHSISMWIKYSNSTQFDIFYMAGATDGNQYYTGLANTSVAGKIAPMKCKGGINCNYPTGTSSNDGVWHHYVQEFTANNIFNLWKDTIQIQTNWTAGYTNAITLGPLQFFGYNAVAYIAYAYLYSKLLSTAEIAQLYNSGTPF
jgi:hypothetical protein